MKRTKNDPATEEQKLTSYQRSRVIGNEMKKNKNRISNCNHLARTVKHSKTFLPENQLVKIIVKEVNSFDSIHFVSLPPQGKQVLFLFVSCLFLPCSRTRHTRNEKEIETKSKLLTLSTSTYHIITAIKPLFTN